VRDGCGVLSAPVNVTASISDDTSGGALTLLSVKSFITVTELEVPDPGELPPRTTPPAPFRTITRMLRMRVVVVLVSSAEPRIKYVVYEAERYLQVNPPKTLFEDMANKMTANLPPD
jgi:hypothetical protein